VGDRVYVPGLQIQSNYQFNWSVEWIGRLIYSIVFSWVMIVRTAVLLALDFKHSQFLLFANVLQDSPEC